MKKIKSWFSLGRVVMLIGALLIAIGIGYEVVNYPWGATLGKVKEPTQMAPPKELPLSHYTYDSNTEPIEELSSLPASNKGLPITRPDIDLTLMGSIKIPRLELSENIVQGVGAEILYAVGHDPATAAPGQTGNCVLAGHRNYVRMHPFKHLPKMEEGDLVQIEMAEGVYTYEVYKVFEVKPEDMWVTEPQPEHDKMLTLVTCTPIPSYSDRLVVWAKLVESEYF